MLTDFFRINMPYGMKRNDNGEWSFYNREYMPLGWTDSISDSQFAGLPINAKYKNLGEGNLLKLSHSGEASVRRDNKGEIKQLWFYDDRTNPMNNSEYWPNYFTKPAQLF